MVVGRRSARAVTQLLDRNDATRRTSSRNAGLGVWVDGAVLFSSAAGSVKARNLAANPAVVVHLESGDEVVILEGHAERVPTSYPGLADAYEAKYDMTLEVAACEGSPWFAVRPRRAYVWLERDYPRTARFDFDE